MWLEKAVHSGKVPQLPFSSSWFFFVLLGLVLDSFISFFGFLVLFSFFFYISSSSSERINKI